MTQRIRQKMIKRWRRKGTSKQMKSRIRRGIRRKARNEMRRRVSRKTRMMKMEEKRTTRRKWS